MHQPHSRSALLAGLGLLLCATCHTATAQQGPALAHDRQAASDAWWTGPLLAAPAAAMPQGHLVVETYLFDSVITARYDDAGTRLNVPQTDNFASLAYFAYGLTNSFTLGLISRFGYQHSSQGLSSSAVGAGDLTLQGQLQVAHWRAHHWLPTISLVLSETLPTGRYDRLGDRPGDAHGAGAYTTTLGVNTQQLYWLPTGRILRCRFNLAYGFSTPVGVRGESVYSTGSGFSGQAQPGDGTEIDLGAEYNLARHWVLALDLNYLHGAGTSVTGTYPQPSPAPRRTVTEHTAASELLRLAPAIEYNWNSAIGIIAGVIVPVAGRNTGAGYTPTIALNMVF